MREARPDEAGVVRTLTLRAYAEYASVMDPDAWAALEQAVHGALETTLDAHRLVAVRDGAVVGSVMLFPPSTAAYGTLNEEVSAPEMRLLAVDPSARGLGVAERLVRACAELARGMGARELGLHTSSSMLSARRLYARLGFERAPERDFKPPGAEIVEGFRLPL